MTLLVCHCAKENFYSYPWFRYLNSDCLDHEGIRGYDDDTFAEGSNDFGRRLYNQLTAGPQENLVISFCDELSIKVTLVVHM